MKAAFYTLGCKVNQYETQIMEQAFQKAGFEIVDAEASADVYVVNSCTVTGVGDPARCSGISAAKIRMR